MQSTVTEQISLDPSINRTGDVWHIFLKGDFTDMLYGYKFDGKFSPEEGHRYDATKILLDPYAKVSFIKYFLCCIFFGGGGVMHNKCSSFPVYFSTLIYCTFSFFV